MTEPAAPCCCHGDYVCLLHFADLDAAARTALTGRRSDRATPVHRTSTPRAAVPERGRRGVPSDLGAAPVTPTRRRVTRRTS